jgi:hypothetical protein
VNAFIAFITALLAMGSAFAFDRSLELMRRRSAETFVIGPRLWGGLAVDLLFVGVLLLSTWFIGSRFRPPRWASLVLVALSGMALVTIPLAFSGLVWLQPAMSALFRGLTLSITDLFPGSLSSIQVTAIFLASLYGFVTSAKPANEMHAA